jgi:DNA polymerase-3 subunit delta'
MNKAFDDIIGNDQIKNYLAGMVEKRMIAQSLLFAGPDGIGKSLFAQSFAKLIVGAKNPSHPDIYHYHTEGKIGMHSIQSMRQFSEEVYLGPYEAKKKVFIIHDAHRMLTYSANALLKTFEEPAPKQVAFFLFPTRLLFYFCGNNGTFHRRKLKKLPFAPKDP